MRMSLSSRTMPPCFCILAGFFVADRLFAQPLAEWAKLTSSDAAEGDNFGKAVSASGQTALVGANLDGGGIGSAYVFVSTGGLWIEQQKLIASDPAFDLFGISVAVDGDTALIGATADDDMGSNSGSVYVFSRASGTWLQQQKITAADGAAFDQFGVAVAVNGDTAAIGAGLDDDVGVDAGAVYIFTRSGGVWTQQQKLTATDGSDGDWFGYAVSVSGNTAVIGARRGNDAGNESGSAYVFVRSGSVWTQQQKLTASDAAAGDTFGISVSVDGDTALVGAYADDDTAANSGSVYVFERFGGAWIEHQKLTAPDAEAIDQFGISVALSGDTAVIGAYLDDIAASNSGSAYVFKRSSGSWTLYRKLAASDDAADDRFGGSVSIAGSTAVIGSELDDDAGTSSGSAYVFDLVFGTCCIPDGACDADGNCAEDTSATLCRAKGGNFLGPEVTCAEACVGGACVPAASAWGMVALALATLAAASVVLIRRSQERSKCVMPTRS